MAKKIQQIASIFILSLVFLPFPLMLIGETRERETNSLEQDQIAKARSVQQAVENYIYLNHGRIPKAVYQKGQDQRAIFSFLPAQRRLSNYKTGQETEPREYGELILNKKPDPWAIYYRYQAREKKYIIYCYGSDISEPLLVLQGPMPKKRKN